MKNYCYCCLAALGLGLTACATDKDLMPTTEAVACAGTSPSAAGRVVVQLREQLGLAGPTLTLLSRDEVTHSCGNYMLKQRYTTEGDRLTWDFLGAEEPTICLTTLGPARNQTDLSALTPGTYHLVLQTAGRATTGTLTVQAERVTLSVCDSNTVAVRTPELRRLPATAVWGTAFARTAAAQQAVAGVLDSLRTAGAQPLALPQGNYGYFRTDAGGQLIATNGPLSGQPATATVTPVLLQYGGSFARLKDIVKRRAQAADLSFTIQSARGEIAF